MYMEFLLSWFFTKYYSKPLPIRLNRMGVSLSLYLRMGMICHQNVFNFILNMDNGETLKRE